MVKSYEDFVEKLNRKIKSDNDFYFELLCTVVSNPNRYTGIFRLSNAKTKLIQNVTQSREVEFVDDDIARAVYDVKPLKVTVPEMIEAGFLKSGEGFYFKTGDEVAKLQDDGKLLYDGEVIDMHTCAAKARGVKANRLNGFDYWYVIRDGERKSIADVRENYRLFKSEK